MVQQVQVSPSVSLSNSGWHVTLLSSKATVHHLLESTHLRAALHRAFVGELLVGSPKWEARRCLKVLMNIYGFHLQSTNKMPGECAKEQIWTHS